MTRALPVIAAILAVGIAATSRDAGFTVQQRGDTTVVMSGAPLHPGVAVVVEELSVGEPGNATTPVLLADVQDIAVDASGSIYVVEAPQKDPVVRKFDSTGRYLRTFGRSGAGPGEYTRPSGIALLRDGRVMIYDAAPGKLLIYSSAGEPLDRWQTNRTGITGPHMLDVDSAGVGYLWGLRTIRPAAGSTAPPMYTKLYIRVSPTGTVIDTIEAPGQEFPQPPKVGTSSLPFSGSFFERITPGGWFVTGHSARYAFELRIPAQRTTPFALWRAGDRVISIRRSAEAVPLLPQERADWRTDVTRYERLRNPRFEWTGPDIPRTKPYYKNIFIGADGRFWVQLRTQAVLDTSVHLENPPPSVTRPVMTRWPEPVVFDVFEATGRYVGRVKFPSELRQPVMRGDVVWSLVEDVDGVPLVKRFRVRWQR